MSGYALKLSDAELGRYRFMAEAAARMEADLWAAAGVVAGAVVADVGCGPGAVSAVLGRVVGPAGRVLAVDHEPGTVEAARTAAAAAGVANVSVEVGEADSTGIAPGSVDVVMIRHVLAHNGPRVEAIAAHAASLVRPGGYVYLADIENGGLRMRPANPDIDDLQDRYRQWHERQGNDLSIGLRLGELLGGAGLENVAHHGRYMIFAAPPGLRPPAWAGRDALVSAGLATAEDIARWGAVLDRSDGGQERPVMFVPLFFAFGRRPAA